MFPFSSMNVDEGDMYEQDDHNQHDHQVNGGSLITGDDQFMGPRSVEEKINDKGDNLPTKSNLGQIKKLNEDELGL